MMLSRSFDGDLVNTLINHHDIRPHVGGSGYLDAAPSVSDDRNHYLIGAHGGFALTWSAPGVYEIHTFILPSGRGKWASQARDEMLAYMGTTKLWTRIRPEDRHTRLFAMRGGLRRVMSHEEDFGDGPVMYDIFERKQCQ